MKMLRWLVVCFAVCCASNSFGQEIWRNNSGDGMWTNPANWSGGFVPTITDDVQIDNVSTVDLGGATGYGASMGFGAWTNSSIVVITNGSLTIGDATDTFRVCSASGAVAHVYLDTLTRSGVMTQDWSVANSQETTASVSAAHGTVTVARIRCGTTTDANGFIDLGDGTLTATHYVNVGTGVKSIGRVHVREFNNLTNFGRDLSVGHSGSNSYGEVIADIGHFSLDEIRIGTARGGYGYVSVTGGVFECDHNVRLGDAQNSTGTLYCATLSQNGTSRHMEAGCESNSIGTLVVDTLYVTNSYINVGRGYNGTGSLSWDAGRQHSQAILLGNTNASIVGMGTINQGGGTNITGDLKIADNSIYNLCGGALVLTDASPMGIETNATLSVGAGELIWSNATAVSTVDGWITGGQITTNAAGGKEVASFTPTSASISSYGTENTRLYVEDLTTAARVWSETLVTTFTVMPSSGSFAGGYSVVLSSSNLGNGSDITNVTLCGVSVDSIDSQSTTQVVVTAGQSGSPILGDVRVYSTSAGETVHASGFTYLAPILSVLGINEAVISSGEAVSAARGTDFGSLALGSSVTNVYSITNSGTAVLTLTDVTTNGAGAAAFSTLNIPSSVAAGTISNFMVKYEPVSVGTHSASVVFTSDDPNSPFTLNLGGSCYDISTNVGPYAGGNIITVTNGYFGTITNILVDGVQAVLGANGDNWFTITLPTTGSAGTVDIVVQTSNNGDTTLADAYTYHPAGQVGVYTEVYGCSIVGPGLTDVAEAVANDGINIYVGTQYDDTIDMWDVSQQSWTNLGTANGEIHDLLWANNELYVSGDFSEINGTSASRVARWDGSSWYGLAGGCNDDVYSMVYLNSNLYVGGKFWQVDGENISSFAKWDGASWGVAGTNAAINSAVQTLCTDGTNIYASGNFTTGGTTSMNRIGRWDGSSWAPLGDGITTHANYADDLLWKNGLLYAGGSFSAIGGISANNIAIWDGSAWTNLLGGVTSGNAEHLAHDGTNLYVSGGFIFVDGNYWPYFVGWTGTHWFQPQPSGQVTSPRGLMYFDEDIYVGGGQGSYPNFTNGIVKYGPQLVIIDPGVAPESGSYTGNYQVIITGSNLCSGTDCTNVTLGGYSVTSIDSQSTTQIIVTAASGSAGIGDVVVQSISFGTTTKSNAFEYLRAAQAPLAFSPTTPQPYNATNLLATTGGSGTGVVSYVVSSGPGTIVGSTNLLVTSGAGTVTVVATKAQDSLYFATSTTSTVAAAKASQTINFPTIGNQLTTDTTPISATAQSGLDVTFAVVSGPATLAGSTSPSSLTYTHSGSVFIKASQAGNGNWLAATTVTNTFTVNKAPQATLTFTPTSPQSYNTTNALTTTGGSGTGVVSYAVESGGGEIVNLTHLKITSGTGTVKVTATKAADALYSSSIVTAQVACAKADQIVAFPTIGNTFWMNTTSASATSDSGLSVSFSVVSGPAQISGGTNISFTGIGSVSIAASQAGSANYNPAPTKTNTFNATGPQFVLLGTNDAMIVSSNALELANGTEFGEAIIGLDVYTNTFVLTNSGNATLTISDVATNGSSSFTLALSNSVIPASSSIEIPVVFDPQQGGVNETTFSFMFDGTNSPYSLNIGGTGLGGGIALVTNELSFTATYNGANPAAQTVDMSNVGLSSFTYTNTPSVSWLSVLPNIGTVATGTVTTLTNSLNISALNAGAYTVTNIISSVDATNSPQQIVVSLTVAKAPQTIMFSNPGAQLTTNRTAISATSGSGMPVTFSVVSGSATLSTNVSPATVVYSGAGVVSITATQAGNGNWLAATTVTNTFMVSLTQQTALPFSPTSPQIYNTIQSLSTSGGSGTGAVSYAVTSGPGMITNSTSLYATSGTGSIVVEATKAADTMYLSLSTSATVTVAKASQTISFQNIGDQEASTVQTLTPSAISGLSVTTAVVSGPAVLNGNTLSFTNSGSVVLSASQTGDNNWNAAPSTNISFNVTKSIANITFNYTNQTYTGSQRIVSVSTVPARLVANITYDGSGRAPKNAGTYTLVVNVTEPLYQGVATGLLTVAKGDQTINFPSIQTQTVLDQIALFASVASGQDVSFGTDLPGVINGGTNLSFNSAGSVRVVASQSGDSNWNAASVTNSFDVIGVITNVTPSTGTALGGTEVVIDGLWLGDGSDITNVTLCNVSATIVTQSVHQVTVLSVGTNAMSELPGDVVVESGFGRVVLTNAYTYDALLLTPTALPATGVTESQFVAHWERNADSATSYFIDVSETTNFTSYTGIYNNWNAGNVTNTLVTGLSRCSTYWYRVRAANAKETSLDSNLIKVTNSQNDSDCDGLPDSWEEEFYGGATNAIATDICANGINTIEEAYVAGLNPTNYASVFAMTYLGSDAGDLSRTVLRWNSVSGRVYSIYWSSNLLSGFPVQPFTNGISAGSFTDSVHGAANDGFYKIDVEMK